MGVPAASQPSRAKASPGAAKASPPSGLRPANAVAGILERAADLIEPEGRWTQGASARDADGNDLDGTKGANPDSAVCFCAAEAIWRVSKVRFDECPAHQFMMKFVGGPIPTWNDAPERTQADVVAKLREAAALASKEAGR